MQSTEQKIERAALAGLAAACMDERERSTEVSLAELAALVETAGGQPVATLLQSKPTPDPRTFLGEGAAELTERVRAILGRTDHHVTLLLPYAQGALLETLHRDCAVLRTDYRDDGIALEVIIHPEQWPRLEPFVIPDEEV